MADCSGYGEDAIASYCKPNILLQNLTNHTTPLPTGEGLGVGLTPHSFKKDSFWLSKGVLLLCKCSPFGRQNESFCNPKGLLLENVKC